MVLKTEMMPLESSTKDYIHQTIIQSLTTSRNSLITYLTKEQVDTLEKPLKNPEKFHNAINSMPSNKAPGPDGFPAERFWPTISPLFMRMIDELKSLP